ncbi:MAG TPA: neutral zinc metallopeptidase [Dongiaceae bacterium]|nr:neutral zinc metallopeptidase [Dongiaceae bacterium]
MLWRGSRRSDNVEDQRGAGGFGGGLGGGGLGGRGFGGSGIRIGGGLGLVAVIVICLLLGVDPSALLQGVSTGGTGSSYQQPYDQAPYDQNQEQQAQLDANRGTGDPSSTEMKDFVSAVLGSTEDAWGEIFRTNGRQYRAPKLVLFTNVTRSGCGVAQSASGPFYCPADSKVYIDLSFYDELRRRFHAPGDFAEAYVIAHEIGHHVQHLLGLMSDESGSQEGASGKSVRIELMADCFAGIWANRANREQHIIEAGDIEEGLTAAAAIGDDRLQKQSQGYVVPDSFTHGTSAQRVRWFKAGFDSGNINACDTSGSLN